MARPDGTRIGVEAERLRCLPRTTVPGATIVSTRRGTSAPFAFGGVTLADLLAQLMPAGEVWVEIEVRSADGFGSCVWVEELAGAPPRPTLVCDEVDGRPLTRREGRVRLIVPAETDDALRQVKWIVTVSVKP